ncbi:MAG: PD-(D/E)XK nuclease-like domain-containing protein [Henriciella sp.]
MIGWHNTMTEEAYHADPVQEMASLSASCAKTVITKSLKHAWLEHPKNPDQQERSPNKAAEFGKAVHAMVFGGAEMQVIEAKSFQTKDARDQRAVALESGKIPVLVAEMEAVEAVAKNVAARFDELYDGKYHAERVAIWQCPRTGGWRRGMMDTTGIDIPVIMDLKTTQGSVDEENCIQRIFSDNHQIQAAAYKEAMETLQPEFMGRVQFYFLYAEQKPPYEVSSPILMSEAAMSLGAEQWQTAGAMWDAAVSLNRFPAYTHQVAVANPPLWKLTQWENRQMTDRNLLPVTDNG